MAKYRPRTARGGGRWRWLRGGLVGVMAGCQAVPAPVANCNRPELGGRTAIVVRQVVVDTALEAARHPLRSVGTVLIEPFVPLEEAGAAVSKQLKRTLSNPQVSVTLNESGGQQQIAGEHLIAPDGTINLGTYGLAYVAGLTIQEAKQAIEEHLRKYLESPVVSVDVFAYNSKVYYVITEGAGFGDNIQRFPVTGNETVLDAVSNVNGLSRLSSKNIWIARPAPGGSGCDQHLPVNWKEITAGAATATNYQILPGDRIFIAEHKMIALDSALGDRARLGCKAYLTARA